MSAIGRTEPYPGVHMFRFPMSNVRIGHALSYMIEGERGELHLVDAGVDSEKNWSSFVSSLRHIGRSVDDIASVTLTHLHHDHVGIAGRLKKATGVSIAMHHSDADSMRRRTWHLEPEMLTDALRDWGIPDDRKRAFHDSAVTPVAEGEASVCDRELVDGEILPIGEGLTVVHTPGHTRGHIVVSDPRRRLLFTGDHLLPRITPGVGLGGRCSGDDPVGDYLASLAKIQKFDGYEVLPGHGGPFRGVRVRSEQIACRHRERDAELQLLRSRAPDASVWEMASQMTWRSGWHNLSGVHLFSALAQTAMYMSRGDRAQT